MSVWAGHVRDAVPTETEQNADQPIARKVASPRSA